MYWFNEAEFVANAAIIRLNAEPGAQLQELGKLTHILVDRLNERILQEPTEAIEKDVCPEA